MKRLTAYDPKKPAQAVLRFLLATAGFLILFGLFACGNPLQALAGMWRVFWSPAALITDYIQVGGMDGAFLNAGVVMMISVGLIKWSGAAFGGLSIASSYIMAGFALFGKTVPNMLPIVAGAVVYARFRREPFSNHVYSALFATCLGPLVSHAAIYAPVSNLPLRLVLAVLLGLIVGFAVPAVAALTAATHKGMMIFNIGLTAGLVGAAAVAVLKGFGWQFSAVSDSWTSGNDLLLGGFLAALFLWQIGTGFLLGGRSIKGLINLHNYSGQSPSDFIRLEGLPATLMNMGVLGFMMMAYVLAVGGPLNGPTIGGILTVCGFGAFCMHYYNVIWPILGIVLLSFVSVWSLDEPGILLAVLFVTAVAPIAGKHGALWGIIAGMVHVSMVRQTAVLFGWMNLYNNGFAAGLTCMVLLPVIDVIAKERKQKKETAKMGK